MKRTFVLTVLICSSAFVAKSYKEIGSPTKKLNKKPEPVARWTGTIKREEKATFSNALVVGTSERYLEVSFSAALPTMGRDDESTDLNFTDDKGSGSHTMHSDGTNLLTKIKCISDCTGSGAAELHTVTIREWDNTYDIEAIAPACSGKACNEDGSPRAYEEGMETIGVSNEKLTDKDVLSGTKTVTSEMPGGFGTVTATTTWTLRRVKEDDVELIVTPIDYDKWLPKAGKDELTRGNVMTVNLKLQGVNGKPLKAKAESFELRLNNTSVEPGITINYPLQPDPKQLPDLRFLLHPSIESLDPDQNVSVSSPDGVTGKAMIASYDGGGWSTLTVEAILKDGRKIQGRLLKPGGEIDIRIPKRDPNSHIGEAWLKKYGNPGEMDDDEKSAGNPYKGDGLTTYEEYRGVISELAAYEENKGADGKFVRLKPDKKELGVRVDKAELPLFALGIRWFEAASSLKAIKFNETEIRPNRRFNMNANTSHIYDQYVLLLYKGLLENSLGCVFSWPGDPDIPEQVFHVVIDIDAIKSEYNGLLAKEKPSPVPFALTDFIANVVAHELGHGVNVWHHGQKPNLPSPLYVSASTPPIVKTYNAKNNTWNTVNTPPPAVRIFNRNGVQLGLPYSISGTIGQENNTESGDLDCIMAYVPYCTWASTKGADGAWIFNEVPSLNVGKKMCNSPAGTSINRGILFFGDAENGRGNCLDKIKLKP
jgi:hypothetical protein